MFTAGRICPQCGYARQHEDFAPECECPRCCVPYARQRREPAVPSDLAALTGVAAAGSLTGDGPAAAAPARTVEAAPRPASLRRRTLAAIYTASLALLVMVPLKLFIHAAIRVTHPPESIRTFADMASLQSLEDAYYFILALVVIYACLFRPLISGSTWGQQKFGLTLRPAAGNEWPLTARAHLLRFAGQLATLAALPLTLAALLFGLVTGRNIPGIADRLSATRQVEAGEPLPPLRKALGRACLPACIALLVQLIVVSPLSLWIMEGYRDQPLRRMNQPFSRMTASASPVAGSLAWAGAPPAGEDAAGRTGALRQNSLGFLTNLQRRHLNERGRYTADLETLVVEYGSDVGQSGEILRLIHQDAIRARLTARGVELQVKLASGEWRRVELQG